MKTIVLNGSPRKKWNTDLMLREAEKGAASVGAETEYINLFDLNYTGCRSCMACKRKVAIHCRLMITASSICQALMKHIRRK